MKPTWLLGEKGNSALEADPSIPLNQKKNTDPRDAQKFCPPIVLLYMPRSYFERAMSEISNRLNTIFSLCYIDLSLKCSIFWLFQSH